ncbi:multiple cyclophane-containing RiPP AmcA [Micromonospora sp. CA-240977]|uniref:multiple cyclophane-containing RiPP AmcA n=1 Tax=Micromonospora sp. CA-240977 TaxID=3239957 RepID=UPI003D9384C7
MVCSQPLADGGGLAGTPASPPRTEDGIGRGSAMTVYVSRYAVTGELATDRAAVVPTAVGPGSADPPLLTHVWRVLFEQQARKCRRR